MNNGQLNITSVQTMTQLVSQEPTASVAVPTDGVEQNGGVFAGLLSGVQLPAKEKGLPDSGQAGQFLSRAGKHSLPPDSGAESPYVDLLAQLHVSTPFTTASEPDALKPEDPEKAEVYTDGVPLGSEPSDVTSQIALAAYSQPGRMPEVNIPTPLPVDMLQNVATVTEQPAVISAPAIRVPAEQTAAGSLQLPSQEPAVMLSEETVAFFAAEQNQHHQPKTAGPTAVDRQPVTTVEAESTPLPFDRPQNAATPAASEPPAIFFVPPGKIQATQTVAEPVKTAQVQTPVTLLATTSTVPEPDEYIVPQGIKTADLSAIPVEKPAGASITPRSELQSAHPTAPASSSSPELEVEIQLSQPQPITARVEAAPVLADNRTAALVQETRGARRPFTPEQQVDKVRTGNEQSGAKEMASSSQTVASSGESSSGSDTSLGSDSNQGQSDAASGNQTLSQQMRGQLSTEHQRVTALSTKAVPGEPVRQDIPEQVMQQVKEHLVQHDVKPGSQQITLTLSPENLGELKINLNLQGQKLSVEIVTENRTVRDAIVQHTDALKESLARQNITMESFDVTTGGRGSGSQGQNQNAWRELAKQQQHWTSPRGYNTAQADLPSGQAAYQKQRGDSMLDIHY